MWFAVAGETQTHELAAMGQLYTHLQRCCIIPPPQVSGMTSTEKVYSAYKHFTQQLHHTPSQIHINTHTRSCPRCVVDAHGSACLHLWAGYKLLQRFDGAHKHLTLKKYHHSLHTNHSCHFNSSTQSTAVDSRLV